LLICLFPDLKGKPHEKKIMLSSKKNCSVPCGGFFKTKLYASSFNKN
jgi:hypothetical protein